MPNGDFYSKDYSNSKSQFSNVGIAGGITAGYMFTKIVGLSISGNFISNPTDANTYAYGINYRLDKSKGYGPGIANYASLDLSPISYKTLSSTIGLVFSITIGEKNAIEIVPSAGMAYLNQIDISLIEYTKPFLNKTVITYSIPSHTSLIVNPKIVYKRQLLDHLILGVNVECYYVKEYSEGIKENFANYYNGTSSLFIMPITINRSVSTILTGVSLTYKF